jgi:Fic family protein
MRLEKRVVGGKEYYYLSKTIRVGNKVKTFHRYLGPATMPEDELEENIEYNKKLLEEEIERYRALYSPIHNLLSDTQVKKLEELKARYQARMATLPEGVRSKLSDDFLIKFTYNTNAIEGSTITERDTLLILKDRIAPRGKSLLEIREVENHKRAYDYMLQYSGNVTKKFILKLHKIMSEGLLGTYEGRFRDVAVRIAGTDVKTAEPENINREMNSLLRWYGRARKKHHPVVAAAVFHARFETIHPFYDYNGRVGRLVLNYMLWREGYPMVVVPVTEREEYYSALYASNQGDYKPIVHFIRTLLLRSLTSVSGIRQGTAVNLLELPMR